jgi:DNA primase
VEEVRDGTRSVRLTRLDQLWWPELGIVKADVVDYYRRIAPFLVPHLRDRPFTMKRHYNGPRSPFQWIKDAPPETPDWIQVAALPAKSRGGALVRSARGLVTTERALARRRGVFIDTKMNARAQQIVCVYSVRPRPGAPVTAPLRWEELDESLDPRDLTMDLVLARVERDGDLHQPLLSARQRLDTALAAFVR